MAISTVLGLNNNHNKHIYIERLKHILQIKIEKYKILIDNYFHASGK